MADRLVLRKIVIETVQATAVPFQCSELQPELTRTEYLRLLQTARALGRERVYLLVKLFGTTGLTVQELEKVTVEASFIICWDFAGSKKPRAESARLEKGIEI